MKLLQKIQLYPWQYLQHGLLAARTIPGLNTMVFKALLINGLVLFLVVAGLSYSFYEFIFQPVLGWIEPHVPDWLHSVSVGLTWLLLAAIALISTLLAIRVSFILLGVWYEHLAEKVIKHHRTLPSLPFRWSEQIHSLAFTVFSIGREIFTAVGLLMLGFVPLFGPIMVFLIGGHWSGRGIIEPYLTVLKSAKLPVGDLSLKPSLMTLSLGAIQVALALIPLVGWVLLPFVMVYQVIGLAYAHEQRQAKSLLAQGAEQVAAQGGQGS